MQPWIITEFARSPRGIRPEIWNQVRRNVFAFILRRFVSMLVVLFCVITLTFLLVRIAPGGPFTKERKIKPEILKQLEATYNLDGTLWEQYGRPILACGGTIRANSAACCRATFSSPRNFATARSARFSPRPCRSPFTLGFAAFLLASASVGSRLGSVAAVRHHTPADAGHAGRTLFLISIPNFVVGPVLILVFAVKLRLLPVGQWLSWSSLVLADYAGRAVMLTRGAPHAHQHVGSVAPGFRAHGLRQGP